MVDNTLTEDDLYRFGRYAVGRRGHRPVVSLPESHALRLVKIKKYTEILAILLFLASAVLFLSNVVGGQVPTAIGGFVIGFRGTVILLSHVVVAKTVVREVTEKEDFAQDQGRIEGTSGSAQRMYSLNIQAQVQNSELHLMFDNDRGTNTRLDIDVQSQSGIIVPQDDEHQINLQPYLAGAELVIDLDLVDAGNGQNDTLVVRIDMARRLQAEEKQYAKLGEFEIPVTISGTNEMSSEVVTTEYDIEILDQ